MATLFPIIEADPFPVLTLEEIQMFHEMDRNLYSVLTKDLWRDPLESMRVMALWLWLERFGFKNVVKCISTLPHVLINEIAEEAMTCINYLTNSYLFNLSLEQIDLPITQFLLGNDVSLDFFSLNRGAAILGMGKALTEVCLRALTDLVQQATERNAARALAETQITMSSFIEPGFSRLNLNNFDRINPLFEAVHPDDRTMFVTFSKGYPVPERDIREFFNVMYGDCIESLHMQDVQFGEQSLYARIVFYTPDVIEAVLNGMEKAKFTIKGRHMWMRKFIPKRRRSLSPTGPLLLPRSGASGSGSFLGL